jgi:Crp-like helix-turn-helix domain
MIRFSQQDQATLTGVSLDSVKKIIRSFKQHEIIATGRQVITVQATVALKEIANGNRSTST